jgi:SAM-dependent methyltransferase
VSIDRPDPDPSGHVNRVRKFYDREAERYVHQRYGGSEPRVSRPYLERLAFIVEMLDVRDVSVLDVGCGPGVLEPHLLDRGCRVHAVDLSSRMLVKAQEAIALRPDRTRVSFLAASAESLPFADAAFDAVACIGVVSYWPDLPRGLKEIARVLRPGGTLLLQASNPLAPAQIEERIVRRPYHWIRGRLTGRDLRDADFPLRTYTPARLEGALRTEGLRPLERRHYDFQPPILGWIARGLADRIAGSLLRFNRSRSLGLFARGFLVKAVRVIPAA